MAADEEFSPTNGSIAPAANPPAFLSGGGELAALVRAHDWSATPLGPVESWPQSLKTVVGLVLAAPLPMIVLWGPDLIQIYNDGYAVIAGAKHPRALGQPTRECWPEVWDFNAPIYDAVRAGEARSFEDQLLVLERLGRAEEARFDLTYSPVRDEAGAVAGVLITVVETTGKRLAEREAAAEQERQRQMLLQMPGFVGMLEGPELVYTYVNDAYVDISERTDFVGRRFRDVFADIEGQGFFEAFEGAFRTGKSVVTRGMPLRLHGRDDAQYVDFVLEPIRNDAGVVTGLFVGGYETTEVYRSHATLRASEGRLATEVAGMRRLYDLNARLSDACDLHAVLEDIVGAANETVGTDRGCVQIVSDDGQRLEMFAYRGYVPEDRFVQHFLHEGSKFACDAAREQRQRLIIEDVATFPPLDGTVDRDVALGQGIRATQSTPILGRGGELIGMLSNQFDRPHRPSEDELRLIDLLAWTAGEFIARNRVEAALRESEARFRNMADHAPVMMWVTDPIGLCTYLNRAWYEFTGQSEAQAQGLGWLDATHPDDKAEAERTFLAANANQAAFRLEYRLRRADNVYRWAIDAASPRFGPDGAFLGYVGSVIDIDERREAEDRQRETAEELQAVLDAVPAAIWIARDPAGEEITGNRASYDVLRLPIGVNASVTAADPATRPTGFTIYHDGQALESHDLPVQRAARGLAVERFEEEISFDDGVSTWMYGNAAPLRDASGKVRGSVAAFVDVTEAKRAEQVLRESEARLRALTDHLPGGMVYQIATGHDGSERRFVYVSQSHERLTGIPAEAVLADPSVAYELILPEDRNALAKAEARAIAERTLFDVQARFRRADGELRWCQIISAPREQPDGSLIWDGIQIDITEQKMAEVALRESEEKYRSLFDSIDAGFCIVEMKFDDDERAIDYKICEMNPAFERQTGLVGARGKWVSEIAPDLERHWHDLYGQVALTGKPTRFENHAETLLDRWYDVHAYPTGALEERRVAVLFNDITVRRRIEEALRESEGRFRALAQAMPNHVWTSLPDGSLDWFNDRVYEYSGAAEGSLDGAQWASLVHRDDVPNASDDWTAALASGDLYETEFRLRRRDGAFRWHITRAVPIRAPDGAITRWIGTNTDIEDQKAAEQALRDLNENLEQHVVARTADLVQAQEALRQSQKLEAMGQLTGGVAHDFNNLLTPIIGSLDLLQRKAIGGEREQRLIGGALQSADRAKTLVQRLLAFARRQPLQATAVDVGGLIVGMADLVASTSGPQIKVTVDVPPELPAATADPNQLEMAILNLSVNARDAMPDGGTLTIAAASETIGSGHRSQLAPGDYVRLSVADTGVGMDATTLARAIEPFFSTKGVGKGTGLGLSMVHGLASQLGGAIAIASKPGLGTSVEFWLPVSNAPVEAAERRQEGAVTGGARGKALLVDDEELVRLSTADMLGEIGFEVIEAASAEAALKLFDADPEIELLVTDYLMPGMTGADLARAVRERRPDLPVLIVSGYTEAEGIAPDLPRLTKPFRQADLVASVHSLIS